MKDILMIAHFTQAPNEHGNGRFHYIASKLASNSENKVEIVTTGFSHRYKKQRVITNQEINQLSYKFTMVDEPGYPKNVCLKRFYSHYIMGRNLKKYLKLRKKPDVIYCAIPSLDAAKVAAKYAKKNKIKFIIDVQDLWPEAFKMIFNIPVLSSIVFAPMKWQADYAYRQADEIIAVSDTYVKRVLSVNKKNTKGYTIFLGTELAVFDNNAQNNKVSKPQTEIWLAYCGTLGSSYDLTCAIDAVALLKSRCDKKIKFVIMGDGPRRNEFEKYAKKKGIYCEFTGNLPYDKMCGFLVSCDININPITKGAAQSIINKHADYAASGHPVVSTQENAEYRKLVTDYDMGFNCENGNAEEMADKIKKLIDDVELREKMGKNARQCAEERFDRKETYTYIINHFL